MGRRGARPRRHPRSRRPAPTSRRSSTSARSTATTTPTSSGLGLDRGRTLLGAWLRVPGAWAAGPLRSARAAGCWSSCSRSGCLAPPPGADRRIRRRSSSSPSSSPCADATRRARGSRVVVALAVAGLARRARRRRAGAVRRAALAAAGVLAVYAAPIVLSGEATFAGYIRLDDTATWMALTDRVMEHGREPGGPGARRRYEATLRSTSATATRSASSCRSGSAARWSARTSPG